VNDVTNKIPMRSLYWRTLFLLAWAALTVLVSARAAHAVDVDMARVAAAPDAGAFAPAQAHRAVKSNRAGIK